MLCRRTLGAFVPGTVNLVQTLANQSVLAIQNAGLFQEIERKGRELEALSVITSVQRRRRWSTAEKVRLVEEAMQPDMSVSYVARRHDVAPSLLFA